MRKSSIIWLIAGVVLGAATVVVTVGVRQSNAGLTASEAQAVAEVQELLGDPSPSGIGLEPIPSLSPELARDLAVLEKQQRFVDPSPAAPASGELLHAPTIIEPIEEAPVSIPSRQPRIQPARPSQVSHQGLPYTGTLPSKLEKLGKLLLPEQVCRQLKMSGVLYVTRGTDGCIELYPQVALDRDAAGRKLSEEEARRQRRLWYSRMTALPVMSFNQDGWQIELPLDLVQSADLDGYLVIIGVGDHFEIWDAQRWQDYVDGKEAAVSTTVEPASCYPDAPF